jgi:hypothetical protein
MRMALELNLERVQANVRKADTEDLLDRATVYRDGMEPAALELIDAELRARGVGEAEIAAHRERRSGVVFAADGVAVKCSERRCWRPAVVRRWGWHCLWGKLPVFPRVLGYCDEHMPDAWREKPTLPDADLAPRTSLTASEGGEGVRKPGDEIRPTLSP